VPAAGAAGRQCGAAVPEGGVADVAWRVEEFAGADTVAAAEEARADVG